MREEWLQIAIQKASTLYDVQIDALEKLVGGYENKMFGVRSPPNGLVLRFTPPEHKSLEEVEAEIDWLNYLKKNDASVVNVIESNRHNLVEVVDTSQGEIPVVCFEWAKGNPVTKKDFSDSLFQTWGSIVGRLHALTKEYHPKKCRRIQWDLDEYLSRDLIPSSQERVLERFDVLMEYFKTLPMEKNSFGLIHQDVHHGNLFLDGSSLTVLDFDDSVYGFFVFDIANALGFSIWEKPDDVSSRQFADNYLKHFMKGYEQENHLDGSWVDHLPYALKLFEFIHYNAFNMDYDLAGEGSFDDLPDRTKNILNRYRHSIEHDLPYIESTFCPYK